MNIYETSADICDSDGNLLYFTNGYYIADKNGNSLINGDTLNPSTFTDNYYWQGDPLPQAAIFLPQPANSRYDYLFHFGEDTLYRPNTIYYSLIDNQGNSGLGTVIKKNIPVLRLDDNGLIRGGGMTACKHGNGRDYWIVVAGSNSNIFYKFLLTPDTVMGPYIQNIGPIFGTSDDLAYSKFSEDGSKYVTSCGVGLVLVMDFNRCSGDFTNPVTISNNASNVPDTVVSGCVSEEFSPNGRFLYVSDVVNLNQYDLWADAIQDSVQLYLSDTADHYGLDMFQLAPNGKIYGSTWNGGLDALHVINCPDSTGLKCSFVYGGQRTLSINSDILPNMINYNLGPLIGSDCDTIPTGLNKVTESDLLHIMPNPADKYLYVEMGMQGNYEFDLMNAIGQLVDKKETRQVDIFDTEHLASGEYFLRVKNKLTGSEVTRKMIVTH